MPAEPRPSVGAAGLVGEMGACAALGAVVGLLGAFGSAQTVRGLWVGVVAGVLACLGLSYALARLLRDVAGVLGAALGWMLCVLYFASGRPEGDVVVPGSASGYTFLALGALAFAGGLRMGARAQRGYTLAPEQPKTSE